MSLNVITPAEMFAGASKAKSFAWIVTTCGAGAGAVVAAAAAE
jgi:hypothetical protein